MAEKNWRSEFEAPSAEYRGKPFWSWNGVLDEAVLKEQIDIFSEMGYGGFHIHSRVGLADEYMGEKFMSCVRAVHDYAKEKGLQTWLYDEDKWPSGFGAGFATQSEATCAKCLLLSAERYADGTHITGRKQPSRLTENGTATMLAAYHVELDSEGYLTSYRRVEGDDPAANRYAYRIVTDSSSWFNDAPYGDLLNSETAERIIAVTHERYKDSLAEGFGSTVPGIFSDEPQHCMSHVFSRALGDEEPSIPYTDGMDGSFRAVYGYSILDKLPEVFWNSRALVSKTRRELHDWLTERFRESYFEVIRKWCRANGIVSDGHVMREEKLLTQTQCVGETMRLYDAYDLPGLDILADRREYSTAKQVQSVAHQAGKRGVICEMFGVTNWDFSFRSQKRQTDWLMALGTTVRVPHLAWMRMGGESKRDYPAPLDFHSPWYSRYRVMEDYFARVCSVMTRGRPKVRVALLHPIESYWCVYGPDDQTGALRARLEKQFAQSIEWLLFGQIDFDLAAESLLAKWDAGIENGLFAVGSMRYEAVVVPPLVSIRRSTLELLRRFAASGGTVVTMGEPPAFADAQPCRDTSIPGAKAIGFDGFALLDALEAYRDVSMGAVRGIRAEHLVYQLREDENESWLFAAVGREPDQTGKLSFFSAEGETPMLNIGVRGVFDPELCCAADGSVIPLKADYASGWTWVRLPFYESDSVLLHLAHRRQTEPVPEKSVRYGEPRYLDSVRSYHLWEDDLLVFDMPEYRLDGGRWRAREEILRLDNILRAEVGYQKRTDAFLQPWITGGNNPLEHLVELRYEVYSEIELAELSLAFEPDCTVLWNGEPADTSSSAYYIDRAVRRIRLPGLRKGRNELILQIPFGPRTNLESCFLLGGFGVRLNGDRAVITALPEKLGFGALYTQGLPFYGGNLTYELEADFPEDGEYALTVPRFAGAMVDVCVDDGELLPVISEPYRARLGALTKGTHKLSLHYYGSRVNTFGQLHNCSDEPVYYGPNSWRSEGSKWSYSYQLRPTGILASCYLQKTVE